MSSMTERADRFVSKIPSVANKPPPDTRGTDQKMAEFSKEFDPRAAMAKARAALPRKKV